MPIALVYLNATMGPGPLPMASSTALPTGYRTSALNTCLSTQCISPVHRQRRPLFVIAVQCEDVISRTSPPCVRERHLSLLYVRHV
ncbi:hypothetical protein LSAT2_003037 [Lamellibrachia satsuma]|nr:hypothetical protein LSAT2_003037 [Lamellibrachia satsuma]